MVFNPVGERGEGEEIVLVNPRVNRYSKKMVLFNEGCLSFPQIYADVEVLLNAYLLLKSISFIFSLHSDSLWDMATLSKQFSVVHVNTFSHTIDTAIMVFP